MHHEHELPSAYLAAVEALPDAALLFDSEGLVHVNPEGLRRLRAAGTTDEAVRELQLGQWIASGDQAAWTEAAGRALAGEPVPALRLAWQGSQGPPVHTSCVFNPLELEGRRYVQLLARDISARVDAEQDLARSEARFRALFDSSPIGMALLEAGRFVVVNAAMCRILGRTPADVLGRGPEEFTLPDDLPVHDATVDRLVRDHAARAAKRYVRPDGTVAWGELTVVLLDPPEQGPAEGARWVLAQLRDVTAEREAAERLQHAALHDPMTGLGNRAMLDERLAQLTAAGPRSRAGFALLFLDLDGFKRVNDALGHAVGDKVLATTASRLRDALRPGDTVVRWGGDEFVVLLSRVADQQEALAVVSRIEAAVSAPIQHRDDELLITVSTGIAYADPSAAPTPAQLLHDADAALYRAKQNGRNRHTVFDEALRRAALRRGHVESLLRQAADGDRAVLHYQPVVDVVTRQVVGAEALLRLRDDDGTLLYPDEFLDIAEDSGLIVAVEHVVLHQACRWAAEQRRRGRELSVAVNVCAQQLQEVEDFERLVHTALGSSGLPPASLVCEVTEHAVLDISERVVAGMTRLRDAGVEFSVDDFGAGHASIDYLHRLPVQEIKLDRAYTAHAPHDVARRAIVRAVAGLARDLGMRCVAEGVEDELMHRTAVDLGVTRGQGNLYSSPLTPAAWEALLA